MTITVSGTAITFPDATTQTTAASYTAGNGISISSGSIALGAPSSQNTVGSYVIGAINGGTGNGSYAIGSVANGASIGSANNFGMGNVSPTYAGYTAYGVTGTWRCCSPTYFTTVCCGGLITSSYPALWVRIA